MFIISLTYTSPIKIIDQHLPEHIKYLNRQYESGNFLVSGRKIPRTGGVIISNVNNMKKLNEILARDPFKLHDLAEYDITEFIPSKTSDELEFLKVG